MWSLPAIDGVCIVVGSLMWTLTRSEIIWDWNVVFRLLVRINIVILRRCWNKSESDHEDQQPWYILLIMTHVQSFPITAWRERVWSWAHSVVTAHLLTPSHFQWIYRTPVWNLCFFLSTSFLWRMAGSPLQHTGGVRTDGSRNQTDDVEVPFKIDCNVWFWKEERRTETPFCITIFECNVSSAKKETSSHCQLRLFSADLTCVNICMNIRLNNWERNWTGSTDMWLTEMEYCVPEQRGGGSKSKVTVSIWFGHQLH